MAGHFDFGRLISSAMVIPLSGQRIVHPALKAKRFSDVSAMK
jgi:hypothetical protein